MKINKTEFKNKPAGACRHVRAGSRNVQCAANNMPFDISQIIHRASCDFVSAFEHLNVYVIEQSFIRVYKDDLCADVKVVAGKWRVILYTVNDGAVQFVEDFEFDNYDLKSMLCQIKNFFN